MSISLAKGVRLHILPSTKFKTVSIKVKFKSVLQENSMTKRSLIASLLDTNSQYYPTQTDFRKALSELYGAQFGTSVTRKGNLHILNIGLNIVNDKYLSEDGVVLEAIQFLHSILFYPHAFHKAFHKETFEREVENLKDEFDSRYDDKQTYASLAVKELYFDEKEHQTPSTGKMEDLKCCTPKTVYEAYEKMLLEDEIDIYVLGDVKEKEIQEAFQSFEFKDRSLNESNLFYERKTTEHKEKIEEQSVLQAKLNLAYETDIYYHQENYYAGQVFNGVFGGYPHSKLFMNVREKESLAYYASSGLDTFRGVMFVQSGIDQKQASHVEELINKQLDEIRQGTFSDESMSQTKEMLKNGLYQSEDSAGNIIERLYATNLTKQNVSIDEWVKKIEAVTKDDVQNIAQNIKQQATFLLKGVEK